MPGRWRRPARPVGSGGSRCRTGTRSPCRSRLSCWKDSVAFIVVTFAANQGSIGLAVLGAAAAVLAVVIAGVAVRAPLARVPENTMKFAVGALLTTFGTFWGGEGAGVRWPGSDAAILVLLAVFVAFSLLAVARLRAVRARSAATSAAPVEAS